MPTLRENLRALIAVSLLRLAYRISPEAYRRHLARVAKRQEDREGN